VKPDYGPIGIAHFGDLTCEVVRDVANRRTLYAPLTTPPPTGADPAGWIPDDGDFLHVIRALKRATREAPR
jgi:hypothetical protein